MTVFFAVLCVLLLAGIGLAAEILRTSTAASQSADADSLRAALDRLASYEPIRRLFSAKDLELVDNSPALRDRLSAGRREAMRRYLSQLRKDFMELWSVCRLLAPVSRDEDFVMKLMGQFVRFHGVFFVLHVRTATGMWSSVEQDLEQMADMLAGLRRQGSGLLEAPQTSGAGA